MTTTNSTKTRSRAPTLAAITKATKPIEAVVPLCVAGDLFARHAQLEDDLERARDESLGSRKLNDPAQTKAVGIAQQIQALEADMLKHTYDFVFRAVPKPEWVTLVEAHPPRDKDEADKRFGVNIVSFAPAAVQACCVSPEGMDNDEEFAAWWDTLSTGQQDRLFFRGPWEVNRTSGDVPKSVNASAVIHSSEQNSASVAG